MVPGVIVFLEQFPLTPNGKINRWGLPAPGEGDLQKQVYVAPRNETEEKLCAIWQQVLSVEEVSIHDDFFTLGGHSLLATRLISLVREKLALEVPVRALFEQPTVAEFSRVFDEKSRIEALSKNRQKMSESFDAFLEGEII